MITALLFLIGGTLIAIVAYALGALNFFLPYQLSIAFQTFFDLLRTFQPFLPFVGDLIAIILVLVPASVIRYSIDLLFWIFRWIPWLGERSFFPKSDLNISRSSVTRTQYENGRSITVQKRSNELIRRNKGNNQS
jgi:hypothetical protein